MDCEDVYDNGMEPKFECLLFDVDDTLYPLSSGISAECTKNIIEYMINTLGMDEEKVPELCAQLYRDHGTTMAGLLATGYDFDYDDYHNFVHGRLPYELLNPDDTLRSLLHSLPLRKVIFSNGNESHVVKVLSRLGLEDCFEDIICFETLNPPDRREAAAGPIICCKPFEIAFEQAFKIARINPHKTVFFDDSIRNLQTAKHTGMHTVWVGSGHRTEGVDYALESIHNMREALPELWEAATAAVEKTEVSAYSEKPAIETYA
ncbi:uncharacterized protein LOC127239314 isoform X2 [Andrographis paniculata]|uniref:uncharacterized protein LOC127239314 isoform X2 n=1 Tax=Andrographis paniculata TaxID=175694 RepID=UPI0021E7B145|nr:uncharacterized protein LOC127239314 isoform X2 [Andrographis paniculata]